LVPQGRCPDYLITSKMQFFELQKIMVELYDKYFDGFSDCDIDVRVGDPANFMFLLDESILNHTCSAAKDRILIRSNGEAQFCAALKHSPEYDYGNIREHNLAWMWEESPMAKKLREFHEWGWKNMKGRCSKCDYLNICKGGCLSQRIYKYKDMYWGPDPLCIRDLVGKMK